MAAVVRVCSMHVVSKHSDASAHAYARADRKCRLLRRRAIALSLMAASSIAAAQAASPPGAISGRIVAAEGGAGLAGAEVLIVGASRITRTDSAGEFGFAALDSGHYALTVRRLGYQPLIEEIAIQPGEAIRVSWALVARPVVLSEVVVQGHAIHVSPFMSDAIRRARAGFGDFIYRDDVSRRNPLFTADLLDVLPGVHVEDPKGQPTDSSITPTVTFARCTDRGGVQVYVDGVRMTTVMGATEALGLIIPSDIEMIEVYRGVARIPAEFLTNACAVIAVWTRRG